MPNIEKVNLGTTDSLNSGAAPFLVAKPACNNQPVCPECSRELAYGDFDMLYCPNPKCPR